MAVNEIHYKGISYAADDKIRTPSGVLYEAKALRSDSLEANSLTVTVFSNDKAIMGFAKNDKVEYFRDGRRVGVYYLQTVERVGAAAYTLSALSALGRLITMRHAGGTYTGQTVAEVVPQICGTVPVMIESVYAGRQLYGYLPYSNPDKTNGNGRSARDNLSQVLFAIGASLGTDENGVMRVEKLWDGVSCAVTADQISKQDCATVYESPVSAVEITEHQWVQNQEEVTLFEGTAEDGAIVVFGDPAHSLTAEGFTVRESGENYAILSAGSGTLTGKGYTHLTRIVRQTVTEDAEENVVAISDATLVSLVNSVDIARRMASYYAHRETVQVNVEPGGERAGSVVSIYHPWDREMVSACIESRETSISAILKSKTSALVGFTPLQPDASEYFDERVILTGSGTWTVPDGTSEIRAVLIGGGSDGSAGEDGGSISSVRDKSDTVNEQYKITSTTTYTDSARASTSGVSKKDGGAGGTGGTGGKILLLDISVQEGQTFSFSAGAANGGESVFGEYSSAAGEQSASGYYDATTQEFFGRPGVNGSNGGAGGSPGNRGEAVAGVQGGKGISGDTITTEKTDSDLPAVKTTGTFTRQFGGSGGGGAGGNSGIILGTSGYSIQSFTDTDNLSIEIGSGGTTADHSRSIYSVSYFHPPTSGGGGNGANGNDGTNYGDGGAGGGGGGGAGAWTSASFSVSVTTDYKMASSAYEFYLSNVYIKATIDQRSGGAGGTGGTGGKGKPGCIILYYRRPKTIQPGPLVTSDQKWLLDSLGRRIIV